MEVAVLRPLFSIINKLMRLALMKKCRQPITINLAPVSPFKIKSLTSSSKHCQKISATVCRRGRRGPMRTSTEASRGLSLLYDVDVYQPPVAQIASFFFRKKNIFKCLMIFHLAFFGYKIVALITDKK